MKVGKCLCIGGLNACGDCDRTAAGQQLPWHCSSLVVSWFVVLSLICVGWLVKRGLALGGLKPCDGHVSMLALPNAVAHLYPCLLHSVGCGFGVLALIASVSLCH
jgi:hypothetical protein